MNESNSALERSFFDAIAHGHVAEARQLATEHPDLLEAFDYEFYGATPITRGCYAESQPMLTTLLDLGADINRRSDWAMGPWSPLHCAVAAGNTELAEFLLSRGAELDAHGAAGTGRLSDLNRLLDEAPNRASELGGDGCQPLHFAATIEVAERLLQQGADINARCVDHYSTPVQYLAKTRPEVARFLFSKGAAPDIFSAILAGDCELVEKLIAADPSVLEKRIDQDTFPPGPRHDVLNIMTFTVGGNCTPMHAAAMSNSHDVVKTLIAAGASVDARGGYDDSTPLHLAAWEDQLDVAKLLVQLGADINAKSGEIHNNSPAGWAIVGGSANVFCYLLDQGAKVENFFADDAAKGVAGEFDQYRCVDRALRERIQQRLSS